MEEMGPVAVWSLPYPSTGGNDRVGGHGEKGELALELLFVAQRSQEGRIILNHLDIRRHRGVRWSLEGGDSVPWGEGGWWMVVDGGKVTPWTVDAIQDPRRRESGSSTNSSDNENNGTDNTEAVKNRRGNELNSGACGRPLKSKEYSVLRTYRLITHLGLGGFRT